MELKICHLYPDLLNLYGDRGNVICMQKRLQWRGIEASISQVRAGEPLNAADFDVIMIGDGQSFEASVLLEDLAKGKAASLRDAAADGVTILGIGDGYQLLGSHMQTQDGTVQECIGAVDLYTVLGGESMIGDMSFACPELGNETIVAFESHDGKTYLGQGVQPLGRVMHGYGNNGKDGTEGVHWNNVFGSYGHGCLLPKNPRLCDLILSSALTRRYGAGELEPLDDTLERQARDYIEGRLSHAASNH